MNSDLKSLPLAIFAAITLFYTANGLQLVFIPWFAVAQLNLMPLDVSFFMAALLLPQFICLRFNGYLADKYEPARLATVASLGLMLCHILFWFRLEWIVQSSDTSLIVILMFLYSFSLGFFVALLLPAKEKMLAEQTFDHLQKGLSLGGAFQFLGVASGAILFGFANILPISVAIIFAAIIAACSAFMWWLHGLNHLQENHRHLENSGRLEINSHQQRAVKQSWIELLNQTPVLRQLMLLVAFNGFMHLGFAITLFPILGLTLWQFDAMEYGLMQAIFYGGCITVLVANAFRSPQRHPGQAALFCLLYTAIIAYALTHSPTYVGKYSLIFLWGIAAGYSASMGKIVLHSVLRDEERAQGAALYQTVLLAMAPLGSLASGALLHYFDVALVLKIVSVSSIGLFVLFLFSKALWAVEQADVS